MTDSPFGSVRPENLPPVKPSVGKGAARTTAHKGKADARRKHYARAIKECEARYGGFFWTCDGKKTGYGGALVSTDLLGFMDIQGVTCGRLIGVNVTSLEKVGAHLRDYTNPNKTVGNANKAVLVEDHIRRFLLHGGTFLILGYFKRGSRWEYDATEVTSKLLDEYKARKRGRAVDSSRTVPHE